MSIYCGIDIGYEIYQNYDISMVNDFLTSLVTARETGVARVGTRAGEKNRPRGYVTTLLFLPQLHTAGRVQTRLVSTVFFSFCGEDRKWCWIFKCSHAKRDNKSFVNRTRRCVIVSFNDMILFRTYMHTSRDISKIYQPNEVYRNYL
jgi:hypothetical protein